MAEQAIVRAGVIGWPVSHSLSPRLHGYWLDKYGIDGEYAAIPVRPEDLAETMRTLAGRGFRGCNVTIPHKEAVMLLLDEVDRTARAIGAVNTVIVQGGKLFGTNTDAYGFMQNIRQCARFRKKHKAVVLGAGGGARAVCKALLDEGFKQIVITNRTLSRAHQLARHFGRPFAAAAWEERAQALAGAQLLVNTTSLGMAGRAPLEIDLALLPEDAVVNDLVYAPLMTPLLADAQARGLKTVDGLGMLMHQAVPGFAAWFGRTPEVTKETRAHILGQG